jgi:hypothetical protein
MIDPGVQVRNHGDIHHVFFDITCSRNSECPLLTHDVDALDLERQLRHFTIMVATPPPLQPDGTSYGVLPSAAKY